MNMNMTDPQLPKALMDLSNEINGRRLRAIELAFQYGGIDGSHHKAWVIDQMVRILAADQYEDEVLDACEGEDGPNTYEWDTGIAP